jgi:hypothetical protein
MGCGLPLKRSFDRSISGSQSNKAGVFKVIGTGLRRKRPARSIPVRPLLLPNRRFGAVARSEGQLRDVASVRVHHEDLEIAGRVSFRHAPAGEHDPPSVRGNVRALIVRRIFCQAGLSRAVRVHHVNLVVALAVAVENDAVRRSRGGTLVSEVDRKTMFGSGKSRISTGKMRIGARRFDKV